MTVEAVAIIEATDRHRAVASLTLAFSFDPVMRWGWPDPGVEPDGETVMGYMRESMDDETFEDINGVFEQMDALHPKDEHWYLPLTGVDPVAQGRGLGTALLRHGLKTCDTAGVPAYLEATSPRNRSLYGRHGFNVVEVIQAGSSPPLWAMLREPAS